MDIGTGLQQVVFGDAELLGQEEMQDLVLVQLQVPVTRLLEAPPRLS